MCTQLDKSGSSPSTSNSTVQASAFQRPASLSVVKGNAVFPHIHNMLSALGHVIFPSGSNVTTIGFFTKFHTSLVYLTTAGSIMEGWFTVYHGIIDCRLKNFC